MWWLFSPILPPSILSVRSAAGVPLDVLQIGEFKAAHRPLSVDMVARAASYPLPRRGHAANDSQASESPHGSKLWLLCTSLYCLTTSPTSPWLQLWALLYSSWFCEIKYLCSTFTSPRHPWRPGNCKAIRVSHEYIFLFLLRIPAWCKGDSQAD